MQTLCGQSLVADAYTSQPYHHDTMVWDPFHDDHDEAFNWDKCVDQKSNSIGYRMSVQTGTCMPNSGYAEEEVVTPVTPLRVLGGHTS